MVNMWLINNSLSIILRLNKFGFKAIRSINSIPFMPRFNIESIWQALKLTLKSQFFNSLFLIQFLNSFLPFFLQELAHNVSGSFFLNQLQFIIFINLRTSKFFIFNILFLLKPVNFLLILNQTPRKPRNLLFIQLLQLLFPTQLLPALLFLPYNLPVLVSQHRRVLIYSLLFLNLFQSLQVFFVRVRIWVFIYKIYIFKYLYISIYLYIYIFINLNIYLFLCLYIYISLYY